MDKNKTAELVSKNWERTIKKNVFIVLSIKRSKQKQKAVLNDLLINSNNYGREKNLIE